MEFIRKKENKISSYLTVFSAKKKSKLRTLLKQMSKVCSAKIYKTQARIKQSRRSCSIYHLNQNFRCANLIFIFQNLENRYMVRRLNSFSNFVFNKIITKKSFLRTTSFNNLIKL